MSEEIRNSRYFDQNLPKTVELALSGERECCLAKKSQNSNQKVVRIRKGH